MKKYIFILADGAGEQTAQYFHDFDTCGEEKVVQVYETASGARVLETAQEAARVSKKIIEIHPSYSVIWCPIESRTIDILS